jgi:hypothetical protein
LNRGEHVVLLGTQQEMLGQVASERTPRQAVSKASGLDAMQSGNHQNPLQQRVLEVELAGLEPATSWVR